MSYLALLQLNKERHDKTWTSCPMKPLVMPSGRMRTLGTGEDPGSSLCFI